jgi:hypothetical protein
MDTLYHAMWTMRDRPEREKQAWRNVFEYYVFGSPQGAGAHLPEQAAACSVRSTNVARVSSAPC